MSLLPPTTRPVALMFAGQGAQHPRMAAGLYGHDESFTAWMDRAFTLYEDAGPALRSEWLAERPSPLYDDVSVAQPLLYAVNHALGRMLLERGVRPVALIGHSVGELAAATLAGVLDFTDGVRLMRDRVRQFADTPPGGMLAVAASEADVADLLNADVHLAAVNAPRQLLLAGAEAPLAQAARTLEERGLICRKVRARQAFHSPLVAEAVTASLPDWRATGLRPPQLPLYSAYTRGLLTDQDAVDPYFWAGQAAATVHFAPTLTGLLADHDCLLVEAGPGNSLSVLARRQPSVVARRSSVLPLLPDRCRGDEADRREAAAAVERLFAPPEAPARTPAPPARPPKPEETVSQNPTRRPTSRQQEPVAVVGMSCRFPGADGLDAFWQLLISGSEAIGPAGSRRSGRRDGGYLDGVELFDAEFFQMPAPEAAATDPQQRLLLELAWHALEDARTAPDTLSREPVGVFVGNCADDYSLMGRAAGIATAYTMTGTGRAFLANRLSHFLGFTGPSLTVDTGQSSSLSALHQALRSLEAGECSAALVAGVQLNLAAEGDDAVQAVGALSPRGRCHTFDSRADGIVRGEGAGVLLLKPLERALADGDRIYCTVLGSAMNSDGGRTGLTAPSSEAQQSVLTAACRRAGVAPEDVSYVELHGTGTALGDPVEASALGAVHGSGRPSDFPLRVGSVKTNIGHLEGAAGIAGFIKTALGLHHGELPASLNYREPNPAIDLDANRLQVCAVRGTWPRRSEPSIAGVSSFGLGGTNCHVVLGEHPARTVPASPAAGAATPVPVLVSGRSGPAMRRHAAAFADALDPARRDPAADPVSPADIGLSSVTTRALLHHRGAVVASDLDELVARLRVLADGPHPDAPGVVEGTRGEGLTAYLFPGQGAQQPGMGRRLHQEFEVFARTFDAASAAMEPALGASLADILWGSDDLPDRRYHAQPALFALEAALYRLFESWGMAPDLLLGHSQGEITAAHVAGVLSLENAALFVARRSRLISTLPPGGAMIAVQAAEKEALDLLGPEPGPVSVAAVNSPQSLVLSGEEKATLAAAAHFEQLGRRTRRLRIAVAGHSPLMEPIQDELLALAEGFTWHPPTGPPIVSAVTGRPVLPGEIDRPGHWPHHLRATVRFGPALRTAYDLGARFFVEIGPGRGLVNMAAETVDLGESLFSAPMATRDEVAGVAGTAAAAHVFGAPIDPVAVHGPHARRTDLPPYPFRRESFWLDTVPSTAPLPAEPTAQWSGDPYELVVSSTLSTLGLSPATELDLHENFNALGLDSRMAVTLRTVLTRATGRSMPTTLLFDHPTPGALIEALGSDAPL
ncbi:acyltransferase domain-containing protein [Streptomyces rubiginosohelvolus]|uniref:acyltransferase domain-containing protein n=1 Tax=Streptomyces rubiginosohelvolus TaxID=67362 RepID=UPI00382BFE15